MKSKVEIRSLVEIVEMTETRGWGWGRKYKPGPCTFVSLLSILGFVEFGQLTQLSAGIFFSIVSVGLQFSTSTHSQPPAVFDFRCRNSHSSCVSKIQNKRSKTSKNQIHKNNWSRLGTLWIVMESESKRAKFCQPRRRVKFKAGSEVPNHSLVYYIFWRREKIWR